MRAFPMKEKRNGEVPDPRRYRIEIPNLIDELDLSPFSVRLYVHYKRVCGASDGTCWEATSTTARICRMSVGSVSKAKRALAAQDLIRIARNGSDQSDRVTVTDIWPQNLARFSKKRSPHERSPSPDERSRSPHETKKERNEEETREETHTPSKSPLKSECVDRTILKETGVFLCSLFPRQKKLSRRGEREVEHWKDDLPLSEENKEVLAWFYGLPARADDIHLRTRRQTAEALAADLYGAIERAEAYAELVGR